MDCSDSDMSQVDKRSRRDEDVNNAISKFLDGSASSSRDNGASDHEKCRVRDHKPAFVSPYKKSSVLFRETKQRNDEKEDEDTLVKPKPDSQVARKKRKRNDNAGDDGFLCSGEEAKRESDVAPSKAAYRQKSIAELAYQMSAARKTPVSARSTLTARFKPPMLQSGGSDEEPHTTKPDAHDNRLRVLDKAIVDLIQNEIMDNTPPIPWDSIAGLDFAKQQIKEIVIWPMMRPDIFKGLLSPARGVLLFGPPGTGKSLIGKCIASQCNATFFNISASSLMSKWIGESEKLVRALFALARVRQPSVIFVDEVDSLLSQRSTGDHEAGRRLKTEFLVQFDGLSSDSSESLLVIGATNRPQEIDEAARRRFVKRLYIPLPEQAARETIVTSLLADHDHFLTEEDVRFIGEQTEGYSCADVAHVCKEAAMHAVRSISDLINIDAANIPKVSIDHFKRALRNVRASVSENSVKPYEDYNRLFGTSTGGDEDH